MKKIVFILMTLLVVGCDNNIDGCTDSIALNYNSDANTNDGSCEYKEGCINKNACNYDSLAIVDNNTCSYISNENCDCNGATLDCIGECNGSKVFDECNVCDGGGPCECSDGTLSCECCCKPNQDYFNSEPPGLDCLGVCNGSALVDDCGICQGVGKDCHGVCGGDAKLDDCSNCVGGETGFLENDLIDSCEQCFNPKEDSLKIQILISFLDLIDENNFIGLSFNATDEYDSSFDIPEPSYPGEYISLSFPHQEWGLTNQNFTQEFKYYDSELLRTDGIVWLGEIKFNINSVDTLFLTYNILSELQNIDFSISIDNILYDDSLGLILTPASDKKTIELKVKNICY